MDTTMQTTVELMTEITRLRGALSRIEGITLAASKHTTDHLTLTILSDIREAATSALDGQD